MSEPHGRMPARAGLHGYRGLIFSIVLLLVGAALIPIGYRMVAAAARAANEQLAKSMAESVRSRVASALREQVHPMVNTLSHGLLPGSRTLEERLRLLPVLQAFLNRSPILRGIRVAYDNGDSFWVVNLATDTERGRFTAPAGTQLMVRHLAGSAPARGKLLFYSEQLLLLSERATKTHDDPRESAWYKAAKAAARSIETPPLLLPDIGQHGLIVARESRGGNAVIGVAVDLLRLQMQLRNTLPTPGSDLAIFQPDGTLVASARWKPADGIPSRSHLTPVLRAAFDTYHVDVRGQGLPLSADERDWIVSIEDLGAHGGDGELILLAIPIDELPPDAWDYLRFLLVGMGFTLLLTVPILWILTWRTPRHVRPRQKNGDRS